MNDQESSSMPTNVNGLANLPNHQLAMTVLMTPDMANFIGNVHGGAILKLLDQVAYACASRYAGRYVVTLSVDQVTLPRADSCRRARYLPRFRQLHG
jgi:acyl-CoA hydrolase